MKRREKEVAHSEVYGLAHQQQRTLALIKNSQLDDTSPAARHTGMILTVCVAGTRRIREDQNDKRECR